MISSAFSRRAFSIGAGAVASQSALAVAARAAPGASPTGPDADQAGVSRSNEAIHQEVVFKAGSERVYRALTEADQFDRIVELSGVMRKMPGATAARSQISPEAGGTFLLFGGYISGRHIELTPNTRIIQVWRSAGWKPHVWSIARFELAADLGGVRLVFDHTGFPDGEGASLARGWREHYWTPMAQLLA